MAWRPQLRGRPDAARVRRGPGRKRARPAIAGGRLWRWRRWLFAFVPRWASRPSRRRSVLAVAHPSADRTPTAADDLRLRLPGQAAGDLLGAEPGQRHARPGSPGGDRRRRVHRGPALLHRGRAQPGQHRAGRSSPTSAARATCRAPRPSPSSTSSRPTSPRSAASPARSRRPPWPSGCSRTESKNEILAGLPEHHLLGPGRLRHPGRLPGLLRQGRQPARACPRRRCSPG